MRRDGEEGLGWQWLAPGPRCAALELANGIVKHSLLLLVTLMGCSGGDDGMSAGPGPGAGESNPRESPVQFADSNLAVAVASAAGVHPGEITLAHMLQLRELSASSRGIGQLDGLAQAESLRVLDLSENEITDISELARMSQLELLELGLNRVSDITPLASLYSLRSIGLLANQVTDLTPLMGLSDLESVELSGNPLAADRSLLQLEELRARGVQVSYTTYRDTTGEGTRRSGRIAYTRDQDVWVLFPDGRQVQLTEGPGRERQPAWSPDGTQLAFASDMSGEWDIYAINADGTNLRSITADAHTDWSPSWSPDGERLAFHSDRDGNQDVYTMRSDGTHIVNLTEDNNDTDSYPAWSPDGSLIAFCSRRAPHRRFVELYVMDADGANPRQLTDHAAFVFHPDWSPSGEAIAYDFHVDGATAGEIFTFSLSDTSTENLTASDEDESEPAWSPDGSQIAYQVWRPRDTSSNLSVLDFGSMESIQVTFGESVHNTEPAWAR